MQVDKTKQVAAIANKFIQHARYKLTPREQKLILYMATLIRQEDSDFETYLVPVSEIEDILKTDSSKKHGSFYERLDDLLDSITNKKITFPTAFTLEGVRLRGYINWVAGAVPKYDDNGILCIEFGFSPQMKPFLLGLKEKFTRIEFLEVAKMKSGFSIRIFQMCKAYFYENSRHGRYTLKVGLKELKQRLGIGDKYPDFRNFRRKVLDVALEEVNEKTSLFLKYDFIRTGRKITDIHIHIKEQNDGVELVKKSKSGSNDKGSYEGRIEQLTEAKRRAFNTLMDYGVNISIVLDEVLPMIKGSELNGYEDHFVLFMLAFFEKKTNRKSQKEKVKAFVGWIRNQRFEEPGLYASLMEQAIQKKKGLTDQERDNRERAKNISAQDFRQLLEEEQQIGKPTEIQHSVQNRVKAQKAHHLKAQASMPLFESGPAKMFDIKEFKKEYLNVYNRVLRERKAAFGELKNASNYRQLLNNSVAAYCEKWLLDNK